MMSDHSHNHPNISAQNFNKAFGIGIILNIAYIVVEVIYGVIINSMALLADAGHNFSDVLGLVCCAPAFSFLKTRACFIPC